MAVLHAWTGWCWADIDFRVINRLLILVAGMLRQYLCDVSGAAADSSLRPQTMLGTISRVVFKPLGFGRFATGEVLLHCMVCVTGPPDVQNVSHIK